jgi:hypothetical protein
MVVARGMLLWRTIEASVAIIHRRGNEFPEELFRV